MAPPASSGRPAGSGGTDGPSSTPRTDRLPIASRFVRSSGVGRSTRSRARPIAVLPEPGAKAVPDPVLPSAAAPVVLQVRERPPGQGADRPAESPEAPRPRGFLGVPVRLPHGSRLQVGRSTRLLLGLLGAVVLVAGGAFLGRFTAPAAAGPPVVTGSVESVTGDIRGSQLTVRTSDGDLVVFAATSATVGTPRSGGLGALRPGEPVTVASEIDQRGSLAATTVLVGAAP